MLVAFVTCRRVTTDFKNFTELLMDAVKGGSQQDLAKVIGITPSRLNRALQQGDYPLNALNCLRLAKAKGYAPSLVLRLAGKMELAELIEHLYGKVDPTMTLQERAHVTRWRQLGAELQRRIEAVLELLPPAPPPAPR